jgi:hypothetical protein
MLTVYKYEVTPHGGVELPIGAEILTVQAQGEKAYLWAKVDTTQTKTEIRRIRCYGTGHKMSNDFKKYIGTFQLYDGTLVFHAFEE